MNLLAPAEFMPEGPREIFIPTDTILVNILARMERRGDNGNLYIKTPGWLGLAKILKHMSSDSRAAILTVSTEIYDRIDEALEYLEGMPRLPISSRASGYVLNGIAADATPEQLKPAQLEIWGGQNPLLPLEDIVKFLNTSTGIDFPVNVDPVKPRFKRGSALLKQHAGQIGIPENHALITALDAAESDFLTPETCRAIFQTLRREHADPRTLPRMVQLITRASVAETTAEQVN